MRADDARSCGSAAQSDFSGIMWRTQRRGMKVRGVIDPRREDGVAMTEFALILPVFMLIVAGILGFGRVFFYWIQANHVANETARWAIVDRNPYAPVTLQQHGANSATSEFNSGADQATVCITRTGNDLGDPLKVTVAKPFAFVPILGIAKVTIRASSTMRVENMNGKDPVTKAPIPTTYSVGCQS